MGATLNTAAAKNAYALTDRGTWLSFENKAGLAILCEGDDRLLNPYGGHPREPGEIRPRQGCGTGKPSSTG